MLPGVNLIGGFNFACLDMPKVATARLSARFHFVQSLHNARAQSCQTAGMNDAVCA
jgi:hypothetical protein